MAKGDGNGPPQDAASDIEHATYLISSFGNCTLTNHSGIQFSLIMCVCVVSWRPMNRASGHICSASATRIHLFHAASGSVQFLISFLYTSLLFCLTVLQSLINKSHNLTSFWWLPHLIFIRQGSFFICQS